MIVNSEKDLLKDEKRLTELNGKELSLDRKYNQLYQKETHNKYSILKDIQKMILYSRINRIKNLKSSTEKLALFKAMEKVEYETFIRSLIKEFESNSYSEQVTPSVFKEKYSSTSNQTIMKRMENISLDFYESLEDSFVIKSIQTILEEKKLGEWMNNFTGYEKSKTYYNYVDGSSTFALRLDEDYYDCWIYQWLTTRCCASHIAGSNLSHSNQMFLDTVPAFLNLIYTDYLVTEIHGCPMKNPGYEEYILLRTEIEKFRKRYHSRIMGDISSCKLIQDCFNKEVYKDSPDFNLTENFRVLLASEWISLFTKFLGYSVYKVWQEDSYMAFQMLDAYMNNFSKFSQTLDLSLIGLSNEEVLKYTRDFGKYGK